MPFFPCTLPVYRWLVRLPFAFSVSCCCCCSLCPPRNRVDLSTKFEFNRAALSMCCGRAVAFHSFRFPCAAAIYIRRFIGIGRLFFSSSLCVHLRNPVWAMRARTMRIEIRQRAQRAQQRQRHISLELVLKIRQLETMRRAAHRKITRWVALSTILRL